MKPAATARQTAESPPEIAPPLGSTARPVVGRPEPALSFSVIIATLARPEPLDAALASLARVRPEPDEILVVDGDVAGSALAVVQRWASTGLPVRHVKAERGLTRQRNRGLEECRGDIVVFLDDDATVAPDVLVSLAEVYRDRSVIGATGRVVEPGAHRFGAKTSPVRRLLPGGGEEGAFTRYGYPRRLTDPDRARDVANMQGAFMTARRVEARSIGFDEHLTGYGLAEDEDFSCRLARVGRLRYLPDLVVHHDNDGFLTRDRRAFGRQLVVNRAYLFRKNFAQTVQARSQFWLLVAVLAAHRAINGDGAGLRGLLEGTAEVRRSGGGQRRGPGPERAAGVTVTPVPVTFVSSHAQLGGSELYLERLLDRLGPPWVEGIISLQEGPFVERLARSGHPVEVLPTSARWISLVRTIGRLRRRLDARRATVVHANGIKAALLAVVATIGRPVAVIWVKHDLSWDGPLARLVAARCRTVVAVSEAAAATLGSAAGVVVVPTGVPLAEVDRTEARRALPVHRRGHERAGHVVALIGRFHPVKGHLELVEALPALRATVPDVHALLIGGDDASQPGQRRRVIERAAERGVADAVTVLGHRDDVLSVLAGADVAVVPSVADDRGGREGFGLTALEAMAVGTPVVAYAHGAVPEVLGDCGTLVTAGDRSGLAAALAELLLDDERRRRLGECGRQRVAARFTPTAMVAGLQDCYATAATGSHRGRPRRR